MKNYKLVFNLLTLAALAYAVLQIKGSLNQNFVENDTPIKGQLNQFLNGKTPKSIELETKRLTPPSLPPKEQE